MFDWDSSICRRPDRVMWLSPTINTLIGWLVSFFISGCCSRMRKISSDLFLSASTVRVVERRFVFPNNLPPTHSIPVYLSHIYPLELEVLFS